MCRCEALPRPFWATQRIAPTELFPPEVTTVSNQIPLKIIPLGGLGEIGMNIIAMEYGDDIIVIDAGLMFPESYMLGVDIVIPDITYLKKNSEKIRGIILTHGHEDHIGALPFILREINPPIYGTRLTLGFVREKLTEHKLLHQVSLNTLKPRDKVVLGSFEVEFIRVSHSIVDGVGLAISTPAGVVIHTGDFKLDQTPVDGQVTDLNKFAEYGERGVLALMADSTNVEREGYTISEREVGVTIDEIFRERSRGRIFVALFSSNIHRVQQVIGAAMKYGRKIVFNGRSMLANVRIARELGYLSILDESIVDIKDMHKYLLDEITIITTGSQGEPMSALMLMSMDEHKYLKIEKSDTIILSSKFIPGNEKTISNLINHLCRRGADVIHEKVSEIHVSGHASQEELKIMYNIVQPKFFIPVHGEYRHLATHARLVRKLGLPEERTILMEDGDVLELTGDSAVITGKVEAGRIFVDGKGVGDVGEMVLRDRKHLSEDGMVIVVLVINKQTGEVVMGPDITTRGFVFVKENSELIDESKRIVLETIGTGNIEAKTDWSEMEIEIRKALRRHYNKKMERKPVIFPIIMEM
ncbi:MAG: ribonuclease J [Deltaproteobacteria bacterium]|nr:ribonuclease J [Deltaproteobacteria bacterium]